MTRKLYVIVIFWFIFVRLKCSQEPFTSKILKPKISNSFSYAGKTYYFGYIFKVNFFKALQYCRQQSMQLVSILNEVENDKLGRFAEDIGLQYEHFWTSGTNLPEDNHWVWISTGSNIVYTNWYPGEPSRFSGGNLTERCLEATRVDRKGLFWNDRYCFHELYFICERYGNEC